MGIDRSATAAGAARLACVVWASACLACGTDPPTDLLEIRVTGGDYRWEVRYPGPDGRLDTGDDVLSFRDVRLPAGMDVRLLLESRDYLYTLSLPRFGVKEIAVPALVFEVRLPPSEPGTFELLGDQLCGYDHPDLIGKLMIQTREDFAAWLRAAGDE